VATLADLKALLAANAPKAATPRAVPGSPPPCAQPVPIVKAAVANAKVDSDVDFASAVSDVRPMVPPNRAARTLAPVAPVARYHLADEEDALLASKYGDDPAPQAWEIGQELEGEQTYLRPGLGADVLTKLRRGHWSVQADVDLHGQISAEAHDTLADFLAEACQQQMRCVRVIHGKGLRSPGGEPVLKGKVRRWLAQWDDVLAYVEAPPHDGGSGAVLVLLRGTRR
jgi:DNA-nicking Smr family endonuclease